MIGPDGWGAFWRRAESLGFPRDRPAMERRIGALGSSPVMALQRLNAYVKTEMRSMNLVS